MINLKARIDDPGLFAKKLRHVNRILGFLAVVAFGLYGGPFWTLGALMGAIIVEANLTLLKVALDSFENGPLKSPLRKTILKFYLAFAATILYCFIVMKFGLGHPLSFLGTLFVFIPSLFLVLIKVILDGNPSPTDKNHGSR